MGKDVVEALEPARPVRINRLLPYWAVLQADLRQTLHSWVYRVWVLLCLCAAIGYLRHEGTRELVALAPGVHVLTNDRLGSAMLPRAETSPSPGDHW